MALFAAYSNANDENDKSNEEALGDTGWLENSSFKIDVTPSTDSLLQLHQKHFSTPSEANSDIEDIEQSTSSANIKEIRKKSKKKKAKKHKKKEAKIEESDDFCIDKKKCTAFKTIKTIARPSAPKYHVFSYIQNERTRKSKRFRRYYQISKHKQGSGDDEKTVEKPDENFMGFQEEEALTKATAEFNKKLAEDPNDVDTWIEYVNFQDNVYQFEKQFRKGSIAKGLRVLAERKLSILDKALSLNTNCEVLLRTRLNVAVNIYPADELQQQLQQLTEREQSNIILWQGYIEATQCSMSHCTTSSVLNLYINCLHTLHTLRRNAQMEKAQLEESILRMLYQCGLFLKQAGLFEQLWTLLRMYLELNLSSSSDKFTLSQVTFDENQLVELEEVILKSQLPIHELWLRVEKLREASHWLPVNEGEESVDPQRMVFAEDVSELIHPITMPGNTLKLTVTILTLLKVPLIPCRHTTMKEFGIDYVPWALDSVETLLPIFIPNYAIDISNPNIFKFSQKLAVGPQYLKNLPGQEEFLQFVLTVMKCSIDCLQGAEQTAISIWWFRFQRLLIILEKLELFRVSSSFKKKIRSNMKNLLRANQSNLLLFKEFALVELDQNGFVASENILKTSLSAVPAEKTFSQLVHLELAPDYCATFRAFIELQIFKRENCSLDDKKKLCAKYIANILRGIPIDKLPKFVTADIKSQCLEILSETLNWLLQTDKLQDKVNGIDHFLPDIVTDWVIIDAWFLYFTESVESARVLVQNVISKLESIGNDFSNWRREVLYEFLVAILFWECTQTPGSRFYAQLDATIKSATECFPNNLFVLAVLAKMQNLHSNYGYSWWKTQALLLKSGHALSTLFLVLITNQQVSDIEENWIDSITGESISTGNSYQNRMLSLFKRLTRVDMCTRRCGLVWRLYLQFLHAYFDPTMCRNAYYSAVEECPWLKALYIDAAIYIPEELSQIQDLIIEKQLRIHVTPEELDVLRN